jgi:hypothetical protein
MGEDPSRAFYVKAWVIRASYILGALQLVSATLCLAFERTLDLGPLLPALFALGGMLTLYSAHWATRTPYATVDARGVHIKPAMLARSVHVEFRSVRAFARVPPGWLVFLAQDGEETRLPLTPLSDGDADDLVHTLQQHLTEVSYVEA